VDWGVQVLGEMTGSVPLPSSDMLLLKDPKDLYRVPGTPFHELAPSDGSQKTPSYAHGIPKPVFLLNDTFLCDVHTQFARLPGLMSSLRVHEQQGITMGGATK